MQTDARDRGSSPGSRLKRVGLAAVMSVVTLNIWTGLPLLGLWVGSRVQGDGPPTMGAIGVVAITIGAGALVLIRVLNALGASYDRVTGRERAVRQHVPWLRSMRGERPHQEDTEIRLSALDIVLVATVIVAVAAFEIWFFFFSGSPIGQGSGR